MKVKVGIVGFGLSGKIFHGRLLKKNSNFEVVKILTSRKDEVKEEFPNALSVSTIDELIDGVDLVINAGPNDCHFTYTKLALSHGCHVVVEKPFVVTSAEGRELIALAEKNNLVLSVFHNRRWDGDFLTIRKLIEENTLGKIKQFESHFDRFRPEHNPQKWREKPSPGAGILFDLGSHLIDQALTLFGEPDNIISDVAFQKGIQGVDDYFHLVFCYEELRVILHATSFGDLSPRFQVFGEKGSYQKFGMDSQERMLRENDIGEIVEEDGLLYLAPAMAKEACSTLIGDYEAFYRNIFTAISEGRDKLKIKPEQALRVIEIIENILADNT